eukprot:scaffold85916_cov30-Tisochrysis_lutea.AAC.4
MSTSPFDGFRTCAPARSNDLATHDHYDSGPYAVFEQCSQGSGCRRKKSRTAFMDFSNDPGSTTRSEIHAGKRTRT